MELFPEDKKNEEKLSKICEQVLQVFMIFFIYAVNIDCILMYYSNYA